MENFLMSSDIELRSNRCDGSVGNIVDGLSWLTSPPSISCSPCWSAASSASSGSTNVFFRDSEEAFCEQLGTAVVNASIGERDQTNAGMSEGRSVFIWFLWSIDVDVSRPKRNCPIQWFRMIACLSLNSTKESPCCENDSSNVLIPATAICWFNFATSQTSFCPDQFQAMQGRARART